MTDLAMDSAARTARGRLSLLLALVRSLVAYVLVSLYVLVVAPPAMLLAIVFHTNRVLYAPARFAVALALRLVGIRFRSVGRDNIPSGGVVFCSNHQSNVDPPVLFLVLHPRIRMLYKAEFDRVPVLARAMRIADFVPIDRTDRQQSMRAIGRTAELVQRGLAFLVFAEGTRSRTGDLLPFKKGVFIMAITSQAPVVPVAITGARAAMVKGSAIIRPVTVSVRIGRPVETRGLTLADRDDLILRVRASIEDLLAQGPIE